MELIKLFVDFIQYFPKYIELRTRSMFSKSIWLLALHTILQYEIFHFGLPLEISPDVQMCCCLMPLGWIQNIVIRWRSYSYLSSLQRCFGQVKYKDKDKIEIMDSLKNAKTKWWGERKARPGQLQVTRKCCMSMSSNITSVAWASCY